MMKKRIFKDWVVMVLGFINILCVLIFFADCEDTGVFCLTHIIALVIFILNVILITKYGKKELFK
jgi:hypothetical protein